MDTPLYDTAVVGAGAAGCMAAIRASQFSENIILLEKNDSIGKKILLTGNGRCNITNTAAIDTFIEKFEKQGNFLRQVFMRFSNQDLVDFFQLHGLEFKTEEGGRVFPSTEQARSVIEVLQKCLKESKVHILYNSALSNIKKRDNLFELTLSSKDKILSKKAILATGGISYPQTGSSGEGLRIAKKLGHTLTALRPALVPLKTKQVWVKDLQGLSLQSKGITFLSDNKKIYSQKGDIIFTHFGVSGPLVLDLSGKITGLIAENKKVELLLDLKPETDTAGLESELLDEFYRKGPMQVSAVLQDLLPRRLAFVLMELINLNPKQKASQVTQSQRRSIVKMLKGLPLSIEGSLPIEEAMVTNGGVSTKEINPRTMESRVLPGLYFAGEIIDARGPSGGYNLQQAFSTGFVAGQESVKK